MSTSRQGLILCTQSLLLEQKPKNSTQNNFDQRSPKRIRIEKPSTLIAFPPVISAPDNIEIHWRMGYKICHVAFQPKSFPLAHIL